METSKQKELIATLVKMGNEVQGHKVSDPDKSQIKKNVKRVFANARERINLQNLVD